VRRVVVTGAAGCIARHALPLLVSRGWDVHAVSRRGNPAAVDGVTWHRADLLDRAQATALVTLIGASHLLHLAWFIAPGQWAAAPENFAWVEASLGLLRAFQAAGGARVVTAGSCLEYDWNYGYCSEARTPCVPHTAYGACKHALQLLTSAFAATNGLSSAWGRIFFVYGPGEHPDRLVASVIRSLLSGEPARTSHGRQIRDYLYAGDVADAFVTLLESQVSGPINVASGVPVTLAAMVTRLGELTGRGDLLRIGAIPAAPTDMPLVVADTTRLARDLGWQPRIDLERGLTQTIDWWRAEARATVGGVRS